MTRSNYTRDKYLNWIKGTAFGTAPTTVYVGLYSSDPTPANSGTEVTTTIRVAGRVAVAFGSVTQTTPYNTMTHAADVDFGNSAGAATVTHFGIFDASSAGNLLDYEALTTSRSITIGLPVKFVAGAIIYRVT